MTEQSIAAYDVSQRVKTYDGDMELMHPNRSKMVQIAIEVLPFSNTALLRAIDLESVLGTSPSSFLTTFRIAASLASTAPKPWLSWRKSA
jgi:hypothetical protein